MTPGESPAPRRVTCPACGGDSVFERSNPFRPFCSERCRLADLGQWASEGFRVAVAPGTDADPDESDPPLAMKIVRDPRSD